MAWCDRLQISSAEYPSVNTSIPDRAAEPSYTSGQCYVTFRLLLHRTC